MMFWNNEDNLDQLNNELHQYEMRQDDLVQQMQDVNSHIDIINKKKQEEGFRHYNDVDYRKNILEKAAERGFSRNKVVFLRDYCDNWNQDDITLDVIDGYYEAEKFLKNTQKPYQESMMYKLSKLFSNTEDNNSF